MPACNEQFATSGGASRPTICAEQHLLALVRAFAIPPPDAKPLGRCASAGDNVQVIQVDFFSAT